MTNENKKIVMYCLYAVALFYTLSTAVQFFSTSLFFLVVYVGKQGVEFNTEQILSVIAFVASFAGLIMFAVDFFTKKLSKQILIIGEIIVILTLLVLFVVALCENSYMITLWPAASFAVLLGINLYQKFFESNIEKPKTLPQSPDSAV